MPSAKPRILNVVPNPWIHIDHQGRPAGACPMDTAPGSKAFVGARVSHTKTQILSKGIRGIQDSVQDTVWEFDLAPQPVPDTPYYRTRLRCGEVLPADEAASRAAGHSEFLPPDKALTAARERAIAEFNAHHGTGAFEALEAERKAAEALDAKPEPAKTEPKTKKGDS